jgi:hypothetical protein
VVTHRSQCQQQHQPRRLLVAQRSSLAGLGERVVDGDAPGVLEYGRRVTAGAGQLGQAGVGAFGGLSHGLPDSAGHRRELGGQGAPVG